MNGDVRTLPRCGPYEMTAVTQPAGAAPAPAEGADRRAAGVRTLALWDPVRGLRAPESPDELPGRHEAAILAGPSDVMRHVAADLA